ncbi:hypothetical protein CC1G_05579 [Coprinopsis cinerea okayama7|uniref:Uncharacterized protein n=1 Tax=Coprinopsis cinerea (strain Okayama-7 / 130 / ATCC MYA-4618 / FGSC 9003) TaxID=240176 RepID=A8P1H7_COPC7|nr:hypothetical protein CC1G_05579 [Coprinopsis cinerea okayama7\|eukprot:XP_001838098.2 hypothetical protein CC1G_05579 [Coprinopsis cinerea okayama7\
MPYLENLVLVDAIAPSSTTHVSPILFPYLSRLRLRARLDDISAFLSCAQFPSGCTLSLTCYDIRDGREFQRLREVFLTRWASSVSPSECSPYSSPFIVVSDGRNLTVTNNLVSGEHRYHDDDDGVPPTSTPVEQTQARQAQFYLQLYPKFKFDHYSKHDWPKLLSSLLNSDAMVSVIADATCFQLGLPFIPIVLVESLKMAKRATHLVNVGELALVALYPILRRELASPSSFGMGVMTVTSPGSTDDCILPALKVLRIEARTLHSHYLPVVVLALSRRSLGWGGIKRIVVGGFAFGTQAGGEEREERLLTRGALLDVPWEVNSPTLRTLAEYGVQVFHTSLYS